MSAMPHLQFMDREELLGILKEHGGQSNLVMEADATVKEFFSHLSCPMCRSGVIPVINPQQPFKEGQLTPNFLAQCTACGCEFEPHTQVIVRTGLTSAR